MEGEDRKYLQETVVPVVAEGMQKLMYDVVKERNRVLKGVDWENGYLPDDWKKIETVKWLGEYLLSTRKKEQSEQQA